MGDYGPGAMAPFLSGPIIDKAEVESELAEVLDLSPLSTLSRLLGRLGTSPGPAARDPLTGGLDREQTLGYHRVRFLCEEGLDRENQACGLMYIRGTWRKGFPDNSVTVR